MSALYGKRWTDEWGPEPHPLWKSELSSMTPAEAAIGWRACRASGDQWPPTLPVFLDRVKAGLKEHAARNAMYQALPVPASTETRTLREMVETERSKRITDVERLKRALGHSKVKCEVHPRTILRGELHPAGSFGLRDIEKAKIHCRETGRSWQDMELELMAHNGWSPDDEDAAQADLRRIGKGEVRDNGTRPFEEAWRKA